MTPHPKDDPKNSAASQNDSTWAEEEANKIYYAWTGQGDADMIQAIALALRQAKNRGLEEAIKAADTRGACTCGCPHEDCPDDCTSRIRALREVLK